MTNAPVLTPPPTNACPEDDRGSEQPLHGPDEDRPQQHDVHGKRGRLAAIPSQRGRLRLERRLLVGLQPLHGHLSRKLHLRQRSTFAGNYSGRLTIAAENDIIIDGNLVRSGNGMLGLIANNFVRVLHPFSTHDLATSSCGSGSNGSGSVSNLRIDAAILAIQHSFIVDHYSCGDPLGNLDRQRRDRAALPRRRRNFQPAERPSGLRVLKALHVRRSSPLHLAPALPRPDRVGVARPARDGRLNPRRQGLRRRMSKVCWVVGVAIGLFVLGRGARQLCDGACSSDAPRRELGLRALALPELRRGDRRAGQHPDRLVDDPPGQCRNCGEPISPRYILAELALALLFCGDLSHPRRRRDRRASPGTRPLLRPGRRSLSPTSTSGSSRTRSSWRDRSRHW